MLQKNRDPWRLITNVYVYGTSVYVYECMCECVYVPLREVNKEKCVGVMEVNKQQRSTNVKMTEIRGLLYLLMLKGLSVSKFL